MWKKACAIPLDDPGERVGLVLGEPGRQRRPDVERQVLVVVDDRHDAAVLVDDAGERVGAVRLERDLLVPVVERRGAGLARHLLRPRVLPGRLVEVPVEREGDGSVRHPPNGTDPSRGR
jgi:hypothetical protein